MLPIITVLTLLQSPPIPGPLDAFRANYASIKVDLQYRYTFGPANPRILKRVWNLEAPEYVESVPDRWLLARWGLGNAEVLGDWSCDGSTEYYHYATPDWMLKQARDRNEGKLPNPLMFLYPEVEAVADASTYLGRQVFPQNDGRVIRPRGLNIWDPKGPGKTRFGPFVWCRRVYPFQQLLEIQGAGSKLSRRTARRNGHPVEVEIYEHDPPEASHKLSRIEVSYDPAVGFLPRYIREVYRLENDEAQVVEMYLIAARPCAAGGFVPTEWYDASFLVPEFSKRYPKYDDDTVIEPPQPFELGHFRVTGFKDRSAPVSLNVQDVKGIHMIGHFADFPPGTRSLTMPQLQAFIRAKSGNTHVSSLPNLGGGPAQGSRGPTLDTEELNQFADASPKNWIRGYISVGVGVVLVFCVSFFLRRRISRRALTLFLLCWWVTGCAPQTQPPVVRLTADLAPNHLLLERGPQLPPLKLVVRNSGNQPLQLRSVDGGCACRKIDQSKLPALLEPGKALRLDVEFAANAQTSVKGFAITFATNRGPMHVPVSLLALPSHQIDPNTFSAILQEGQEKDWQFELVHRAVFRGNEPKPTTTLEVPPEFSTTKVGSQSEPVSQAPELHFEDTTYRITLRDQSFGIRKAFLTLRGAQGEKLIEVPAAWQRVPFLSTTPDRIVLGAQPVRVFLRCTDDRVELTRVIAMPPGIKAVVSSARELTVMLDDGAPDVIGGQVEVGTTASGRPPLKIPVVRYARTPRAEVTPRSSPSWAKHSTS